MKDLLARLGLEAVSSSTWTSNGGWLTDPAAPRIDSVNPV